MNKADLITEVQKLLGLECSKAHAERAVNAVFGAVERGLQVHGEVQVVGFGSFQVKDRAARMGRNPQTNQPMQIPASRTVGFRVGSGLRAAVARPPALGAHADAEQPPVQRQGGHDGAADGPAAGAAEA
jgi:DNA-binding protein HU-beta